MSIDSELIAKQVAEIARLRDRIVAVDDLYQQARRAHERDLARLAATERLCAERGEALEPLAAITPQGHGGSIQVWISDRMINAARRALAPQPALTGGGYKTGAELQRGLAPQPAEPACARCGGTGEIAVAETFPNPNWDRVRIQEGSEECPECTPAEPAGVFERDAQGNVVQISREEFQRRQDEFNAQLEPAGGEAKAVADHCTFCGVDASTPHLSFCVARPAEAGPIKLPVHAVRVPGTEDYSVGLGAEWHIIDAAGRVWFDGSAPGAAILQIAAALNASAPPPAAVEEMAEELAHWRDLYKLKEDDFIRALKDIREQAAEIERLNGITPMFRAHYDEMARERDTARAELAEAARVVDDQARQLGRADRRELDLQQQLAEKTAECEAKERGRLDWIRTSNERAAHNEQLELELEELRSRLQPTPAAPASADGERMDWAGWDAVQPYRGGGMAEVEPWRSQREAQVLDWLKRNLHRVRAFVDAARAKEPRS